MLPSGPWALALPHVWAYGGEEALAGVFFSIMCLGFFISVRAAREVHLDWDVRSCLMIVDLQQRWTKQRLPLGLFKIRWHLAMG